MANNVNRWIEGNREVKLITVASGVTVEIGDLMFLDNADNLRNDGSSTASNFAYPLEYLRISGSSLTLNIAQAKAKFIGIALDDKDGISDGLNMKIPIASAGKYTLDLKPAKTIYVGNMFGPTGTTSASNMYNQKVAKVTDTDLALGFFAQSRTHAQDAEGFIFPAYGPSSQI